MSFTDEQIAALKSPLNRANVKSRAQAGRSLSYIEGWKAIEEANRIFGFDKWDRETVELRECGEPRQVGDKWRVAFMCRVRIRVRPSAQMDIAWSVIRDGIGYGSGIDKDLGQAFESAIKEAETDAMKRALMTFGNPFGLALYDKDQANVADMPSDEDRAAVEYATSVFHRIEAATDARKLTEWWNSPDEKQARRDFGLTPDDVNQMKAALMKRLEAITPQREAAQ
jgi:DNA repair and recombination protein RAD52